MPGPYNTRLNFTGAAAIPPVDPVETSPAIPAVPAVPPVEISPGVPGVPGLPAGSIARWGQGMGPPHTTQIGNASLSLSRNHHPSDGGAWGLDGGLFLYATGSDFWNLSNVNNWVGLIFSPVDQDGRDLRPVLATAEPGDFIEILLFGSWVTHTRYSLRITTGLLNARNNNLSWQLGWSVEDLYGDGVLLDIDNVPAADMDKTVGSIGLRYIGATAEKRPSWGRPEGGEEGEEGGEELEATVLRHVLGDEIGPRAIWQGFPTGVPVRVGWGDDRVASENYVTRLIDHPDDSPGVGAIESRTGESFALPSFPPALGGESALYLHIWIGDVCFSDVVFHDPDGMEIAKSLVGPLTVEGVEGRVWVSDELLARDAFVGAMFGVDVDPSGVERLNRADHAGRWQLLNLAAEPLGEMLTVRAIGQAAIFAFNNLPAILDGVGSVASPLGSPLDPRPANAPVLSVDKMPDVGAHLGILIDLPEVLEFCPDLSWQILVYFRVLYSCQPTGCSPVVPLSNVTLCYAEPGSAVWGWRPVHRSGLPAWPIPVPNPTIESSSIDIFLPGLAPDWMLDEALSTEEIGLVTTFLLSPPEPVVVEGVPEVPEVPPVFDEGTPEIPAIPAIWSGGRLGRPAIAPIELYAKRVGRSVGVESQEVLSWFTAGRPQVTIRQSYESLPTDAVCPFAWLKDEEGLSQVITEVRPSISGQSIEFETVAVLFGEENFIKSEVVPPEDVQVGDVVQPPYPPELVNVKVVDGPPQMIGDLTMADAEQILAAIAALDARLTALTARVDAAHPLPRDVRVGWSQTRVASTAVLLRVNNHPVDGALLTAIETDFFPPPFPPALNTDADLYLHVWVEGAERLSSFLVGGAQNIGGVPFVSALTVSGVPGQLHVSTQRLVARLATFVHRVDV